MYEKPRVNVKVEPRSTFTFTNYATVEIHLKDFTVGIEFFPCAILQDWENLEIVRHLGWLPVTSPSLLQSISLRTCLFLLLLKTYFYMLHAYSIIFCSVIVYFCSVIIYCSSLLIIFTLFCSIWGPDPIQEAKENFKRRGWVIWYLVISLLVYRFLLFRLHPP